MIRPTFIHATMNGSKTANLLTSAYNYKRQGKHVLLFKPSSDTRSGAEIKSRAISNGQPAIPIPADDDNFIWKVFMKEIMVTPRVDCIFIDEAQMLTVGQIDSIARIARSWSVKVFLYGLMTDYQGNMFSSAIRSIERGFRMVELSMTCDFCHNEATNHLLFVDGKVKKHGDILIIGDQEYKSVCNSCFEDGMNGLFDNDDE